MITRIVKMTFREEEVANFKLLFQQNMKQIKAFSGCHHLELLQEEKEGNIFFTYSVWESDIALQNYRQSTLFKTVWANTKSKFAQRAEAWSTLRQVILTD